MAESRRIQTAAFILPVFGALLCVPPLLSVFNVPATILGIPLVAIYLFSVWTGLIAITFVLSRRLGQQEDASAEGEDRP